MRARAILPFVLFVAACGGSAAPVSGPAAPSELIAGRMGGGVHLTWKDNSSDEAEFQIERKVGAAAFARLDAVPFDITQYHDEPVTAGETYTYRVRAAAGAALSAFSNEATIRIDVPDAGAAPSDLATGSPPDLAAGNNAISFRKDIVPIIQQSCGANNNGCHSREAYAANKSMECRGWLTLEDVALGAKFYSGNQKGQVTGCPDRTLYDRLTQLDSWMCQPRKKYVRPGSLAQSQIYQVVAGDPSGGGTCQKSPGVNLGRMPPPPAAALSQSDANKIRDWINAGAPNN